MPPMSQTETGSHLPALAGHDDRLFSDDAVALVYQTSRGYPARSTTSHSKPSSAAFAADKAIVDEFTTRTAIAEVTAD